MTERNNGTGELSKEQLPLIGRDGHSISEAHAEASQACAPSYKTALSAQRQSARLEVERKEQTTQKALPDVTVVHSSPASDLPPHGAKAHHRGRSHQHDSRYGTHPPEGFPPAGYYFGVNGDFTFVETSSNRDGQRVLKYQDTKGHTMEQTFDDRKSSYFPQRVRITDKDGTVCELECDDKGELRGSRKDKSGKVIDRELAFDALGIYRRSEGADHSITKTYDSGQVIKTDAKGEPLFRQWKDEQGREIKEQYAPGNMEPTSITMQLKPGEKPITFERNSSGRYIADLLNAKNEKTGTIELGRFSSGGTITYQDRVNHSTREERPGGVVVEKTRLPNGEFQEITSGWGRVHTTKFDWQEPPVMVGEEYKYPDNRTVKITYSADGKEKQKWTIDSPDHSRTELEQSDSGLAPEPTFGYFPTQRTSGIFKGVRRDPSGNITDDVLMTNGRILFRNRKTEETTLDRLNFSSIAGSGTTSPYFRPEFFGASGIAPDYSSDKFDANRGLVIGDRSNVLKTIKPIADGRLDVIENNRTVLGSSANGDHSFIASTGESRVQHSDGAGVRLNADNTIDRWGAKGSDCITGEALSVQEKKFLDGNQGIDRRDLAEIHRRLNGDTKKLDAFYTELDKIASAKNLSLQEKRALRDNLMHHVAFPAEISQGKSPTCNVTVIQRDMAILFPDKYVSTVVQAVSEGQIKTADNQTVKFNPANLKLLDLSERDLASRIFQTAAFHVAVHPDYAFQDSEDGAGKLLDSSHQPGATPRAPYGLALEKIALARYRLTGEEKGICEINDESDLIAAFQKSGGVPMIAEVNGATRPFHDSPYGNGPHVVTITGFENGPPLKVFVQNQWGLQEDHSTKQTAFLAEDLLPNMLTRGIRSNGNGTTHSFGRVLVSGKHDIIHKVEKGNIVEDKNETDRVKHEHVLQF